MVTYTDPNLEEDIFDTETEKVVQIYLIHKT